MTELKLKDFTFSKKSFKDSIYKKAIEDYNSLIETFEDNNYNFSKIKRDIVFMRNCGKGEFDFDFQSLTVTVINDNTKIKIKTIRVYDLKSCDFLCYMNLKNKRGDKNDF